MTADVSSSTSAAWEQRVAVVRKHFERKGYRVHSGLQFGCELVLYADDPSRVHSDFCIHLAPEDGKLDWREIQTLVRSMPDFHKTLIVVHLTCPNDDEEHVVHELAFASEHAPFRHRKQKAVGSQRKKQKVETDNLDSGKLDGN